jgi:hypothetical protein
MRKFDVIRCNSAPTSGRDFDPRLATPQVGVAKISARKIRTNKVCTVQVGTREVRTNQDYAQQVSEREIRPGQVGAAQIRNRLIQNPPEVPLVDPLRPALEQLKQFFAIHGPPLDAILWPSGQS